MSRKINAEPPKTVTKSTVIESASQADVDQEMIKGRLMEVLRRESVNLMSESAEGRLERDRSAALVNYLRFLNTLEDLQAERLAELSDEELTKQSS